MYLAEFIIALAGKHRTVEKFKAALQKNGAEFPVNLAFFKIAVKLPLKFFNISFFTTNTHRILS